MLEYQAGGAVCGHNTTDVHHIRETPLCERKRKGYLSCRPFHRNQPLTTSTSTSSVIEQYMNVGAVS